jgi:hypothetical protein
VAVASGSSNGRNQKDGRSRCGRSDSEFNAALWMSVETVVHLEVSHVFINRIHV